MQEQKSNSSKLNLCCDLKFNKQEEQLIKNLEKIAKEKYIPILKKNSLEYILNLIIKKVLDNTKEVLEKKQAILDIKILEIGTAIGYTTIQMYFVLEKLAKYIFEKEKVQLNIQIFTIEKAKENYLVAMNTFKNVENSKIRCIYGDAMDVLNNLKEEFTGAFDIIFIDANKSKYLEYLEYSAQFLKDGGYILMDNIFLNGLIFKKYLEIKRQKRALHKNMYRLLNYLKILDEIICMKYEKEKISNEILIRNNKFFLEFVKIGDGIIKIQKNN